MSKTILISAMPARHWEEALPTGSGSVGAMVYGSVQAETILLNHEGLWYGGQSPALPDISCRLPELRALLKEGRYKEANGFYSSILKEYGYSPAVAQFMPGFDFMVKRSCETGFTEYTRRLDMSTGEISVNWKEGEVSFSRRLFVSRDSDLVIMNFTADQPARITCDLSADLHTFQDAMNHNGSHFDPGARGRFSAKDGFLFGEGTKPDGWQYGFVARAVPQNGTITAQGNSLHIEKADSLTVLIKMYPVGNSSEYFALYQNILGRMNQSYEALLARHTALYKPLFDRVALDLNPGSLDEDASNEALLLQGYNGDVSLALLERMFYFSRFMLIASSKEGGLPANLQGIWNGDWQPPWSGGFFFNENIQMNYWQALPGQLPETILTLFDLLERTLPDFQENARKLYGCRGILLPVYTDHKDGHVKDLQPHCLYWTAGAGWMARFYYDYYLYTGDTEFLKNRAIPFLTQAADFYVDFFTEENGQLVSAPSNSPENYPKGDFDGVGELQVAINSTMDFAVAKEVLTNLVAALRLTGTEGSIDEYEALLSKMPPYAVNEDGAVCEYLHPDFKDNYEHRHQSHIYPLFPGLEITRDRPGLWNAFGKAVEKRLVVGLSEQTGWSLSHMANIYARLGDGGNSLLCLEYLLRSCCGPNLFTAINDFRNMGITRDEIWGRKPPTQIDALLGYGAAVLEMLCHSTEDTIFILPALPDKFSKGSVSGLQTRAGITIDSLQWDMSKKEIHLTVTAGRDNSISLRLPFASKEHGDRLTLSLKKGETHSFVFNA